MTGDDSKDKDPTGDQEARTNGPRPLGQDLPDSDESVDVTVHDHYSDDSQSEYQYSHDYDDDAIDYDVDPDSITDEEDEEDEPEIDPADNWHSVALKPELERPAAEGFSARPGPDAEDIHWADEESTGDNTPWPFGLIIVAAVALLLLAAGGYGVMQQRAGLQEEIRSLQAVVATSASPDEVTSSREDQRVLEQRNTELRATIEAMQVEILALRDTATGLQSQLQQTQARTAAVETTPVQPTTVAPVQRLPVLDEKTNAAGAEATSPGAASADKPWFVNFSSYRSRETASSWAAKLKPSTGTVVVAVGVKSGTTFYRVRVVELSSKEQAEGIARALERQYELPKLWVGKQ